MELSTLFSLHPIYPHCPLPFSVIHVPYVQPLVLPISLDLFSSESILSPTFSALPL